MTEERHGGPHTHEGLAIEGEDGQEEDGVGLKMKGLDLIVVEDGVG